MPRIIDADVLVEKIDELYMAALRKNDNSVEEIYQLDHLSMLVKDAPTVDAVEVVRCKECKHRGIVSECPMCYTEDSYDEDYGYDYWDVDKTVDDGFCHCGETMDAEVEE